MMIYCDLLTFYVNSLVKIVSIKLNDVPCVYNVVA